MAAATTRLPQQTKFYLPLSQNASIPLVTQQSTLYEVYRILDHLNSTKLMTLNDTPRFIVGPGAYMPRNYSAGNDVCQIQFSNSTNYPWAITLVGRDEAKTFPPFTPVTPAPNVTYEATSYDDSVVTLDIRGEPLYRRAGNETATTKTNENIRQEIYRNLLRENDYDRQLRPDDLLQTSTLHIPTRLQPTFSTTPTRQKQQPPPGQSICKNNSRIVYQLTPNAEEFYRPNLNNEPTPLAATNDVIQRYRRLLGETNATENTITPTPVNEVPPQPEAMITEPIQTTERVNDENLNVPSFFGGIASPPSTSNDVFLNDENAMGF